MATIYLRHADHGEKVATLEQEAQYDETLGWVRFSVDDPATEINEGPQPEPTPAPRGRGRPRNVEPEPEVVAEPVPEPVPEQTEGE